MALAVPMPDEDEITTEWLISNPEIELLKALVANVVDIEERVVVLEGA